MIDRYECIFCQTKCGSLDQLKEHSGECQKHPLMEWKTAVIDAAVVGWTYTKECEDDPRKAINDLLCLERKMALDPAVSEEAKVLHDDARRYHHLKEHGWPYLTPLADTSQLDEHCDFEMGIIKVQPKEGAEFF